MRRALIRVWVISLIASAVVAAIVYAVIAPWVGSPLQRGVGWFLWPGIALWVQLNGSLLFGAGYGAIGDFLVIVLASALAWSIPIAFVVWGVSRLRQRRE
jgi:hypothetical protein